MQQWREVATHRRQPIVGLLPRCGDCAGILKRFANQSSADTEYDEDVVSALLDILEGSGWMDDCRVRAEIIGLHCASRLSGPSSSQRPKES